MIAKEVADRGSGGSFGGLVAYLTNTQGTETRVGRVRISNCVSTDAQSAVLEVLNTQARNRRAVEVNYHLILSFRAGERPAAAVLERIEDRVCEALGFYEAPLAFESRIDEATPDGSEGDILKFTGSCSTISLPWETKN